MIREPLISLKKKKFFLDIPRYDCLSFDKIFSKVKSGNCSGLEIGFISVIADPYKKDMDAQIIEREKMSFLMRKLLQFFNKNLEFWSLVDIVNVDITNYSFFIYHEQSSFRYSI